MEVELSYVLAGIAAFILGMSKAGFKGLGFVVVTLLALVYEAKASTGILMPLLIFGDIVAIYIYRYDVRWEHFFKLMPWMIAGVLMGVWVGDNISLMVFRRMMAATIFISGLLMLALEFTSKSYIPYSPWFARTMGFSAGFTTMIGNLAGAFSNLYFLAMRLPKKAFIGTAAWIFFAINIFKLPFHIFAWETVTVDTFLTSMSLIPFVVIGLISGLKAIQYLNEQLFKRYIILITLTGALLIFFK